ncbi:MAG: anthranilate phosphoribosyltransferase [Candidatus Omnitrophica bacterium]|nr:anthranilate phosphoribosyltransferase [Candidatus Omnitrophota bacterium]
MTDSLQPFVSALKNGRYLTAQDAEKIIAVFMSGDCSAEAMAEILTAWHERELTRGATTEELVGAARAMRSKSLKVKIRPGIVVDTCGTGGDRLETFNISTVAALIVAGAGVRVAKHGNRGSTSRCGSADLLEALGVGIDPGPEIVARCIEKNGFGFLFAPRFHPAMKHVAPVRKQLGFKTIFNLLGPLTNPAGASHQLVGVSEPWLAGVMGRALKKLGSRHVVAVYGMDDCMDEVSLTGRTHWLEFGKRHRPISRLVVPEQFGLFRVPLSHLQSRSIEESRAIALKVIQGASDVADYRDAAALNAGCALYLCGKTATVRGGIRLAQETLRKGRVAEKLEALVKATHP